MKTLKTLQNFLPFAIIGSLMLSIIAFLGSLLGFMYTNDPVFIQAGIVSMQAIFGSIVFGMASLFLLD